MESAAGSGRWSLVRSKMVLTDMGSIPPLSAKFQKQVYSDLYRRTGHRPEGGMATVMWDLDGVACSFIGNFYPWLCALKGFEPQPWITWNHHHNHGMTNEDFVACLTQYGNEGGFGDQKPYPEFQEAVKQIHAAGHMQCVVTDRPEGAQADTCWWIEEYAPLIDTIDFSRDKTVFKAHGEPTYYAIDDRIENVEKMRAAGIFAYLLTRPWNEAANLPRVATLQEFVEIVTGVTSHE